jgi:hypothetical protein
MVILLSALSVSTADVIDACLKGRVGASGKHHEKAVKAALNSISVEVVSLREHIISGKHASFPRQDATQELTDAMVWLYEKRLGTVAAVEYRSAILALGANGCPFCHASLAPTIEHSFPKATYPYLTVTPINMVPCCRDCNTERNVGQGTISVSPYIDSWLEEAGWLSAKVLNPSRPWILSYSVDPPPQWSASRRGAVNTFFEDVKMAKRYRLAASQEFASRSSRLLGVLQNQGLGALRDELGREAEAHGSESVNHHKSIAYRSWLASFGVIDWSKALSTRAAILLTKPAPFIPLLL